MTGAPTGSDGRWGVATPDAVPGRLEDAVHAAVAGRHADAMAALRAIDVHALVTERRAWQDAVRQTTAALPRPVRRSTRNLRTAPAGRALAVFHRDSWTCCYCGRLTVASDVLRVLSMLYPQVLPFHPNWKIGECHLVYWVQTASLDHVVPLARGGDDVEGNTVTACYLCNDTKGTWRNEEIGYRLRRPAASSWDGLTGALPGLSVTAGAPRAGRPGQERAADGPSLAGGGPVIEGSFIRVALPGKGSRRSYAVARVHAGQVELREMWRSSGRWAASPRTTSVAASALTNAELVKRAAPAAGDVALNDGRGNWRGPAPFGGVVEGRPMAASQPFGG